MQAMRAAARGRGRRSPAFEVTSAAAPSAASLQQLLKQARASGSLNLTSKGLEEVPSQVFNLLGVCCVHGVSSNELYCSVQTRRRIYSSSIVSGMYILRRYLTTSAGTMRMLKQREALHGSTYEN